MARSKVEQLIKVARTEINLRHSDDIPDHEQVQKVLQDRKWYERLPFNKTKVTVHPAETAMDHHVRQFGDVAEALGKNQDVSRLVTDGVRGAVSGGMNAAGHVMGKLGKKDHNLRDKALLALGGTALLGGGAYVASKWNQ